MNIQSTTKRLISWLSGALLALLFGFSAHAQDKVIKMGSITYVDTLPLALISKKMLELEGHKVELTTFSEQGILFAALAKGDIEITPNYLNYVNIENWKKYNRRLEKVSVVTHGLYQCLVVPSYVPINSIEELRKVCKTHP